MLLEELHNRYGVHVARRLQKALTAVELQKIALSKLPDWLETRAEIAHKEYEVSRENPFIDEEVGAERGDYLSALYRRWQSAEELSYVVAIAEDAGAPKRGSGKG